MNLPLSIIVVILLVWFWLWYDTAIRKPKKAREAEALKREAEEVRIERETKERLRLEEEAEEKAEAIIRPARKFLWDSWVHFGTDSPYAFFRKMSCEDQIRHLVTQFGLSPTEAEELYNQFQNDIP